MNKFHFITICQKCQDTVAILRPIAVDSNALAEIAMDVFVKLFEMLSVSMSRSDNTVFDWLNDEV